MRRITFLKQISLACLLASLIAGPIAAQEPAQDQAQDQAQQMSDLIRKTPTPFGPPSTTTEKPESKETLTLSMPEGAMKLPMAPALEAAPEEKQHLKPIAISKLSSRLSTSSLTERLVAAKIYLPDHMVLGKTTEFTVRGKPGQQVALAMAEKNEGASPIYGHNLRLGADRKVVAIGVIDTDGSIKLSVTTPIQGDLVGEHLYFEAALWTKNDFSDVVIATPVALSDQTDVVNGVLVLADAEKKKRLQFMSAPMTPMGQSDPINMNSGQP